MYKYNGSKIKNISTLLSKLKLFNQMRYENVRL